MKRINAYTDRVLAGLLSTGRAAAGCAPDEHCTPVETVVNHPPCGGPATKYRCTATRPDCTSRTWTTYSCV